MKKILKKVIPVFLLLTLISNSAIAQMQFMEIKTETDWKNAMVEANSSGKLVFLDIYATWCGPCKYLESDIYPDSALGKYYNSHFINLKMDGETEFGRLKAAEYALSAYPTMYYISASEDMLSRVVGVKQAPELLEFGKKVVNSSAKLVQFKSDFDADKLTAEELMEYRALLLEFEQEEQSNLVAAKILPSLSDDDILNPIFKNIILSAKTDLDGKLFKFMKDNNERLKEFWSGEELETIYSNIFGASLNIAIVENDIAYRDRIINEFLPVYIVDDTVGLFRARYITNKLFFANTGDWKSYGDVVNVEYLANQKDDDKFLYEESYEIVNNYNQSPEATKFAFGLMETAIGINPSFDNLIMGSYLSGINGNLEKAKEYLAIVEAMTLSEDQKKILKEIQSIVEKAG